MSKPVLYFECNFTQRKNMYINLTYLLIWIAICSIIGHQVIIKKVQRTAKEFPHSKAGMTRAMVHILMTLVILPLELVFNFWSAIEKK